MAARKTKTALENIPEFLKKISDLDARRRMAAALKCHPHYLYMIATGRRTPSAALASKIARRSRLPRALFRA